MSSTKKLQRRRQYGSLDQRIQKIKDNFHIETPKVTRKPSPVFTYIPPKYRDEDSKASD